MQFRNSNELNACNVMCYFVYEHTSRRFPWKPSSVTDIEFCPEPIGLFVEISTRMRNPNYTVYYYSIAIVRCYFIELLMVKFIMT